MRLLGGTLVVLLAAASLLSGATAASAAARITLPPRSGTADYQLGGAYKVPSGVTVVTRDSRSKPAPGVYSICYINGFQTQGFQRGFWLDKHADAVLTISGKPVADPGWPDEFILDTSTAAKRAEIGRVFASAITKCAAKGFKAVEIDNLDSFLRSHGRLTVSDNRAMAKIYANRAHSAGLAIAQKNTPEHARNFKKTVGFDFAIAEECDRYQECARYTKVYSRVIDIEYTDDLRGSFADVCGSSARPAMTILRDRDLVPKGQPDYVYSHC